MNIKVLGSGCPKCNLLEEHTKQAIAKLDITATIEKVTDYQEMLTYGVMSTPALVIDGKVVSMGRVLKTSDIVTILQEKTGNLS